MASRSYFSPLEVQEMTLVRRFHTTAFKSVAFNTQFPPFMTSEYALAPFSVESETSKKNANLTAQTTKYSAQLNCWPTNVSEITGSGGRKVAYLLSDTQGCNVRVLRRRYFPQPYNTSFVFRWNWEERVDTVKSPECFRTPESKHQLTVLFSRERKHDNDSKAEQGQGTTEFAHTPMFCQAQYYQQQVMATVSTDGLRPYDASVKPVSDQVPFDFSYFNLTLFETLASHETFGKAGQASKVKQDADEILQFTTAGEYFLTWEYPAPFIYSKPNFSEHDFYEPETLERELKQTFKLLFSLAVSQTLANQTTGIDQETASLTSEMAGIIVSRVFSALVESLFVLNAALSLILLYTCRKSQCCLSLNPNSISRLCGIDCPADAGKAFSEASNLDEKRFGLFLGHHVFRLRQNQPQQGAEIYFERVSGCEGPDISSLSAKGKKENADIRPFALTQRAGTLLVLVLIGSIATLIGLKMREVAQNGLSRPSNKSLALRVITKYIPTIFATLLEAFWVLLNRHYCTLQPFQKLCAGKARPSKTIETTYSAVPPPLALWRAIKAHHFNLAAVCVVTLLGNLLGIGLGALLNENETIVKYPRVFSPIHPDFDRLGSNDPNRLISQHHFQHLLANMSSETPLSPWLSREYFFQPYSVGDEQSPGNYMLRTRGFGAHANCKPISDLPIPTDFSNNITDWSNANWCNEGAVKMTGWFWAIQSIPDDGQRPKFHQGSPMSLESGCSPDDASGKSLGYPCTPEFTTGWARLSSEISQLQVSAVHCQPSLDVAIFDVVVDGMGLVQSYTRVTDVQLEPTLESSANLMLKMTTQVLGQRHMIWHNDTRSADPMSSMILTLTEERDFLNATLPPPDPSKLVPTIEQAFQRYFSMALSIDQDKLNLPEANSSETGYILATERRIFMDNRAFAIALAVLSIDILFAAIFLTWPWDVIRVLPRMPNDLASTLAYITPSRLMTTEWKETALGERTLSFGRYTGSDGKEHVGIEFDPHVQLLDAKRPSWTERLKKKQSDGKSSGISWHYRLLNHRRNDS
ncbi:hypothetical protein CDD81_1777 [Ophiocordyceps australis]|uniref:Uncharacterized protein n=1 Tax=Ophiocordyceps australis TaxID=1399860 RepID=A0A2C5YFP2_9HYPO|nr:hypothetical protein CDD81_1777 [Ophiocordyceps australis]